jgi:hypothetical protein
MSDLMNASLLGAITNERIDDTRLDWLNTFAVELAIRLSFLFLDRGRFSAGVTLVDRYSVFLGFVLGRVILCPAAIC